MPSERRGTQRIFRIDAVLCNVLLLIGLAFTQQLLDMLDPGRRLDCLPGVLPFSAEIGSSGSIRYSGKRALGNSVVTMRKILGRSDSGKALVSSVLP